jgi:hypothetical protein
MPTFEVYVDDDRYSVPSLYLITADNAARARAMAEELWRGSEHHLGVEVMRDGERLFVEGSYALSALQAADGQEASSV